MAWSGGPNDFGHLHRQMEQFRRVFEQSGGLQVVQAQAAQARAALEAAGFFEEMRRLSEAAPPALDLERLLPQVEAARQAFANVEGFQRLVADAEAGLEALGSAEGFEALAEEVRPESQPLEQSAEEKRGVRRPGVAVEIALGNLLVQSALFGNELAPIPLRSQLIQAIAVLLALRVVLSLEQNRRA